MSEAPLLDIRPAEFDDAAGIARVQVAAWRALYKDILPSAVIDAMSDIRAAVYWAELITKPLEDMLIFVAISTIKDGDGEKETLAGFLSAGPFRGEPADTDGEVYTLYVDERYQRNGAGSGLVRAALANMRVQGKTSCRVWARADSDALDSFYKKMRAVPTGTAEADFAGTSVLETAYDWDDIGVALSLNQP